MKDAAKRGALSEWTIAVKENIDIAGEITVAGSPVLAAGPPADHDAEIVHRLRAVGGADLGHVGMHEFAFGVTGVNPHYGTPENASDPGRIPGGSSSGSASAVAAGSARLGIGTDTGGSVRIPAALCGVIGLKLPYEPDLMRGVFPLSPTLDHLGLFTRDLADVLTAAAALSLVPTDPRPAQDVRFALWPDPGAEPAVLRAFARLANRVHREGLREGPEGPPAKLPLPDRLRQVTNTVMFYEAAQVHAALTPRSPRYGPDVRERLAEGARIPRERYEQALRERAEIEDQARAFLADGLVLLEPTVPLRAPLIAEASDPGLPARLVSRTRLANAARLPALTLPLLDTSHPVGVQITGTSTQQVLEAACLLSELL